MGLRLQRYEKNRNAFLSAAQKAPPGPRNRNKVVTLQEMSAPGHTIDSGTVEAIRQGDEVAFARLYDAYYSYLCASATAFIHNREAAKDVVNEVFMNVWRRREFLHAPIHPYLVTALRNGCLNWLRQTRGQQEQAGTFRELLDVQMARVLESTPLDYVQTAELRDLVIRIADALPDRCREIFRMYFDKGLNAAEIAEILGLASSTVRVQLKTALERIRAALSAGGFLPDGWK